MHMLGMLQEAYPTFSPFLEDMMRVLGFAPDWVQREIGEYLENGGNLLMVQAQRSQAKTTVAAIFCVYELIHDPQGRVLIVSAGKTLASQISKLIVQLIMQVDVLACLRPDRGEGDRTSTEAFDIHHTLKGPDKSPSIACLGLGSNMQGFRATLLLVDDAESLKNSETATQRARLLRFSMDFQSICDSGRIVYLGTPQSIDSIYNTLPGRGYSVRIWPGRYPTKESLPHYGEFLAPTVLKNIAADPSLMTGGGSRGVLGKTLVNCARLGEAALTNKELDQGPAFFQLQHLLLTSMTDAERYPLKTASIVLMPLNGVIEFPMAFKRAVGMGGSRVINTGDSQHTFAEATAVSDDRAKLQNSVFYIDPAGGGENADSSGWAHVGHLNSNLFLLNWGGVRGGFDQGKLEKMARAVLACRPGIVMIEKNFGYGAYREMFTPILRQLAKDMGVDPPPMDDDYVTGQKEKRIIATLEPIIGRGSFVVNSDRLHDDSALLSSLSPQERTGADLFFQLSRITAARNALVHDDVLDAVAGAARYFVPQLTRQQDEAIAAARNAEAAAWFKNPTGLPSRLLAGHSTTAPFQQRLRRFSR
jgi:hypothetical protein